MRVIEVPAPSLSVLPQARPAANTEVWTIKLKTITPMFGGGATVREVNSQVPIRGASVRGHLRFWWRATAGAGCAGAEDLFKKEEAIWGSAREPGKVGLRVTIDDAGKEAPYAKTKPDVTSRDGPLEGGFLFPFARQKNGMGEATGRKDVRFTLTLAVPDEMQWDVRRAVGAWIMFGGVGARTRRGLGAMAVEDAREWLPPVDKVKLGVHLRELAGKSLLTGNLSFTCLNGGRACFGEPETTERPAWRELGWFWSRFRKGHYLDGGYQPRKSGRWPDHNNLLLWDRRTGTEVVLGKPVLGLPIIYQKFQDRQTFGKKIEPSQSGRMASPVILKPVAFADGSIRPMIALLSAPGPKYLQIGDKETSFRPPDAAIDPVLRALRASDPLDAVIKAAEWEGYKMIFPL